MAHDLLLAFGDREEVLPCDSPAPRRGRAEAAAVAAALRDVLGLLDADLPRVTAPDVHDVYARLYTATIRQLQAVQAWCHADASAAPGRPGPIRAAAAGYRT